MLSSNYDITLYNSVKEMKIKVEATLPLPAKQYFIEKESPAFISLQGEILQTGKCERLSTWKSGESYFVKRRIYPGEEHTNGLPSTLSNNLAIDSVIEYNPGGLITSPYETAVQSEMPFMKGVSMSSKLAIAEHSEMPETHCIQTQELEVQVKILFLGKILEKALKRSMERTYEKLPQVVEAWKIQRESLLKTKTGAEQLVSGRPQVNVPWMDQVVEDVRTITSPTPTPSPFAEPMFQEKIQEPGVMETETSLTQTFNEQSKAWSSYWQHSEYSSKERDPVYTAAKRVYTLGKWSGLVRPSVTVEEVQKKKKKKSQRRDGKRKRLLQWCGTDGS